MVDAASKKYKKLPACDYCKVKRVLCHPQQNGSCPRCLEKGVACNTTPVTRRKRRTKAELEQERAATSSRRSSVEVPGPQSKAGHASNSLEIWRRSSSQHSSPSIYINLASPSLDISPSLVKELFQDLRILPQYYYPFLPLDDLEASLDGCSWSLHALAPHDRVLAQCIIAISARISTSSLLVDLGNRNIVNVTKCSPLKTRYLDCREFGRRREQFCQQMRAEAVWLAQREGVMYNICIANAVSLVFLEFLEYRASGKGGNVYSAAYFHQLRQLSEDDFGNVEVAPYTPTAFSALLMGLAVCAATTGKSVPFTYNDELLLCGEDGTSLEQILNVLSPNSVVETPIFDVMRPMCFHTIHLARDISETLTGAYARRHPLNETKLTGHLHTLDLLHSAITCGLAQMQRLRSTADEAFFQNMRFCAYPLILGWSSLVLLVFEELKGRREHIRLTEVDGSSRIPTHFDSFYIQVRSMASQAALEVATSLEEVPTLSRLTHMNYSDLRKWPTFLLEDAIELNVAQRVWALERFRDGLSLAGFSWVDRTDTVEAIDAYLASCTIEEITGGLSSIIWPLTPATSCDTESLISDWLQVHSLPVLT
ncbi:hypothetical protein F5050DRAFT_530425 [Lentinula boryana]|uniref:Zn(2)-C6 fungal-type domain-containing protein n=1 Tax=Lentinula boryana TaxID=40481 RepID=A0ABQ8Q751_9AGAR|nr:hypothetical protein F5050DRAFT_530425 [Lentinula boryana]